MIHKGKYLVIVLACLALAISALSCAQQEENTAGPTNEDIFVTSPRPPVWMELQLPKAPEVGEEVELTCTMYSSYWDLPGEASIEFELADREHSYDGTIKMSSDKVLANGDLNWKGILNKKAATEFSCIVKFPYEGDWRILGRFNINESWVNPYDQVSIGYSFGDSINFHVGKNFGMFGWEKDYSPNTGPYPYIASERFPMTVQLDISKAPRLDEPATLTWAINSIRDIVEVNGEIKFYLMEETDRVQVPAKDVLVEGDLSWEGDVGQDVPVQLMATVKFPQEGDWEIRAWAHSPEQPGGCNDPQFLSVGKEKSRFGWVEPHEKKPTPGIRPTPIPIPFSVEMDLEKTPRLNEPVKLTCTLIAPSEDVTASARVSFRGPEIGGDPPLREVVLVDGDLSWEGVVTEDIPVQFSAIIKFPLPGDWKVSLYAEGYREGQKIYSKSDGISVHVPGVAFSIDAPGKVAAGSNFTARVKITEVANLDAYQFDLTYDPTVIEIIGVEGSAAGVTPGLINSTSIPIDMWDFSPPGEPGTMSVTGNVPGDAGVTGSGYLAEVHFHAISSSGDPSDITVSSGQLLDNTGTEITPITWLGDSVYVTPRITVSIDAPREVATDGEFVVRVNVTEVTNFCGCQFDVTYDARVIEIIGVEGGATGVTPGLIDSTAVSTVWGFVPPGMPGTIRVIGELPFEWVSTGITGSGYLAEVHFRVIGSRGSASDITLSNGMLFDNTGEETPVTEWLGGSAYVAPE